MGGQASAGRAFQIEDDALEVRFIENLLALGGAEQQSVAAEIVDAAGHAFRVVVDAADEAVAEEGCPGRKVHPFYNCVLMPCSVVQS